MVVVGLLLGVAFYLDQRFGRRPRYGYFKGEDDVRRLTAKPLIAVGLIGAVLWIVAALR
jgi:hypothetical protein